MHQSDPSNSPFDMAMQFVNFTSRHLFLTGKAGTGKTTFLKTIRENSHKKLAIVAPTGVAAINAGGVTIHSFFQLPFGSFIPEQTMRAATLQGNFHDRNSLRQHMRVNAQKRELIQQLELLIVDEVSMVRADLLDAMDYVLRIVRRKPDLTFGGVQVLFIGDLFQLPPVVNDEEWKVTGKYYESPFFFHAKAVLEYPPIYLELKKIYRQSDNLFIELLNKVRCNEATHEDLQLLNRYYRPEFDPEKNGEYITLTTHNNKADTINQSELRELTGTLHTFKAIINGEFNEKSVPAEVNLQLKEGAQIMFVRNDKGESRRYYNGKIGTIKKIDGESIYVVFPDETGELLIEKDTWRNIRYRYNQESDQIEEEELGTFTQYPIRLAWAITIHKSQGLTFNKAIIDAGESFAPGQVYVALSRLTSLEGLVLYSPIHPESISTHEQALDFSKKEVKANELPEQLQAAQKEFIHVKLLQCFNFSLMSETLEHFSEKLNERQIPLKQLAKTIAEKSCNKSNELRQTGDKFCRQLEQLLPQADSDNYQHLHSRTEAAANYFGNAIQNDLLTPLQEHSEEINKQSKVKKYLKELKALQAMIQHKQYHLQQAVDITLGLKNGNDFATLLRKKELTEQKDQPKQDILKNKLVKGESQRTTLQLFKEGKSVEAIAELRSLTPGTIEGHLCGFILSGELGVNEMVSAPKIDAIKEVIKALDEIHSTTAIKEKLGDEFTYGEIRAVLNDHRRRIQQAEL